MERVLSCKLDICALGQEINWGSESLLPPKPRDWVLSQVNIVQIFEHFSWRDVGIMLLTFPALPTGLSHSGFSTKLLCTFLIYFIRVTFFTLIAMI
jgi:hypothetical protein